MCDDTIPPVDVSPQPVTKILEQVALVDGGKDAQICVF